MSPKQWIERSRADLEKLPVEARPKILERMQNGIEREEQRLWVWAASGSTKPCPTPWSAFDLSWISNELAKIAGELTNG